MSNVLTVKEPGFDDSVILKLAVIHVIKRASIVFQLESMFKQSVETKA